MDHDPNISVELTDDEDIQCIRIRLGSGSILLHTRSAIDLHQKLGKAICDWIGEAAIYIARHKK